ncbi:hypothetical protein A3K48_05540 [candidate division WOR-1 bacterium RIFOXYA12_FULL_52_29]|uniref:Outer membrane protein beta-barrel domain-containing protein n=1 Tax=candidate division WOR-1 bacterium RIFOXYC12_FULL_54_18 TaxID=1802584 RepID=A0A1F4T777_UNCSA|nr:MAG: hypothetical protein A3K44_05540 [candidate division WOR-1 bacterium RIFOXYA2_FULL_51_19]OGC18000.1 MAG: hypothetical protein A3K48_05540 [candidate division WOR-1 bacterium RIFOXYA12_FULL_52_29]OGC26856.1 MAG: hypothetical protein A3K32_05535 [candidate division WOR-1 bacterium RIFOXYB2_FULL_45_9]OGC28417.1 MAG: hypothetical protein A3K49_05540 [candidate division WOR-1 bacterium RIFOXYC12_FULL_54_18]OGC31128.1 MAG: hypothetical protein A2346_07080 [candidate division WOR-1 bacterium R
MKKLTVSLAALLLFCGGLAHAFPSVFPTSTFNGPSGLVRLPSADVVPYKNYNFGMSYGSTTTSLASSTADSVLYYYMNMGSFHGLEIGVVGGNDKTTNKLREGVFVNMKLSLSADEDSYPLKVALGVENLFSYTQTDVYMVATKYFKQGPKMTFGFMADFPNYKFRPFGVLGAEFPTADTFILVGDFMLGENLSQLNAGARIYFSPIFCLNVSGLNVLDSNTAKDQRSVLIGFSWANPI